MGAVLARRSFEQIFLDNLTYMAGDPPTRISSYALRQALGWEDARYDLIRLRLIESGVIRGVVGGPGGSLELLGGATELAGEKQHPPPAGMKVFISYSHADSKIKNDLVKHLSPLTRLGIISHWHDGEIKPGDEWQKAISLNLNSADIVLLIISADFISSEYCYVKELDSALARHKAKKSIVVPVIARNCLWDESKFKHLQVLPDGALPIMSWPNQDDAMTDVAKRFRDLAQEFMRKIER